MILVRYISALILLTLTAISCQDGQSLQRYLVDKQDDDKFVKVDIATSLLESNEADFTQEQRDILNTIKKINVVAYPLKGENQVDYTAEKTELRSIIDQEKYKALGSFNSNGTFMTMKYLGTEDAIDEVIVFASDDDRGFAIFRLLGDKMNPGQMMKLMSSLQSGDLDLSAFGGIGDLLEEEAKEIEAEMAD